MRALTRVLQAAAWWSLPAVAVLALGLMTSACVDDTAELLGPDPIATLKYGPPVGGGGGGGGHEESFGNNLSFPVIWAEGVAKPLRGEMGTVLTEGAWWWWWGEAATEQGDPLSCPPDPDNVLFCNDNVANSIGPAPGDGAVKAYLQKEQLNEWQAANWDATEDVVVNTIDWGDALESVPWYLNSQVRIEVVLARLLETVATEYRMVRTSGWGSSEVWGLVMSGEGWANPELGPGTEATVYSPCGRLTMQKLALPREDPLLADLEWSPSLHQWVEPDGYEDELIAAPFFNKAVHEAADGPGYFNAEINVKGKIIFGYTWNVRKANEGAGDYRLTFSLDGTCPTLAVNTFFEEGTTTILVAEEEEEGEITIAAEGDTGGTAMLDFANNLTYIDIHILSQKGGGGRANPKSRK